MVALHCATSTPSAMPALARSADSTSNSRASRHLVAPSAKRPGGGAFRSTKAEVSETTLDGNSVSLEEEMMKMTEARMNYDAAISFYQKSMNLLRMAARPPGR